jgi:cardiolipin synthase
MVVDGCVALVGSANIDRRSFELNFENNILFDDPGFAAEVRARQDSFIAQSDEVTADQINGFGLGRRLAQNFFAMLGPLL